MRRIGPDGPDVLQGGPNRDRLRGEGGGDGLFGLDGRRLARVRGEIAKRAIERVAAPSRLDLDLEDPAP